MSINQYSTWVQWACSFITLSSIRFSSSYIVPAQVFLFALNVAFGLVVHIYVEFPYTILIWAPVTVTVSIYLLNIKWGMFWCLINGITIGIVLFLPPSFLSVDSNAIELIDFRAVALITIVITMSVNLFGSYQYERTNSQLNRELSTANNQLKEHAYLLQASVEEKKKLVHIVCHDIANPLMIASLNATRIKFENLEKDKDVLDKIRRSTEIIAAIIKNVRLFESVQSGKRELILKPVNLIEIFQNSEFMFKDRLEEKNLSLKFQYTNPEDLMVMAEEDSLSNSVFNNMISNAIKFSENGSEIIVTAEKVENQVLLKIRDFGIGIPELVLEDLFKTDVKTTRVGTSGEKGTGFGMPISKAIMEIYGGTIDVVSKEKKDSSKDHGTTFILSFGAAKEKNE